MDDYIDYELSGGPLCGHVVPFPIKFDCRSLEFWLKGRPDTDRPFHRYELDEETATFRYDYKTGPGYEAIGADFSDEVWPEKYAKIKEVGQLSVWVVVGDLTH